MPLPRPAMSLVAVAVGLVLLPATVARAQTAADQTAPRPSLNFAKLFPNPTGRNGYEDFTRAGDLLKSSAAWQAYEQATGDGAEPTLAAKRAVLADPIVAAALDALAVGVTKPVRSPRQHVDDETLLPELSSFRAIARALAVRLYVEFADGSVSQAIDTLGEGLQFAYDTQTDTLINGLVAIAVDAIVIKQVALHLDQLSVRDCDHLQRLAEDWLRLPSPEVRVLTAEHEMDLAVLNKYRTRPADLLGWMDSPDSEPSQQDLMLQAALKQPPGAVAPVFDQAAALTNLAYEHTMRDLARPQWQRTEWQPPQGANPLAVALVQQTMANLGPIGDRYARDRAVVQMLAIHAAVRRYRWERERLPATLAELRLGEIATDPFSGKPFAYRLLDAARYELASIGPFERGSGDQPSAGQRAGFTAAGRTP